jgi:hypothetical protein
MGLVSFYCDRKGEAAKVVGGKFTVEEVVEGNVLKEKGGECCAAWNAFSRVGRVGKSK